MLRAGSILGLLVVTAVAGLVACSQPHIVRYRQGVAENQQALQQLRLGMSAAQVRALMGSGEVARYKKIHFVDPARSESFALADGSEVLLLYYLTQPARRYARPQDQDLTPIALENGRVVGWGWSFLRQQSERYRIATPPVSR